MSREIKFRVWDDGDKVWVNDKYLFDNCLNPFDQHGSFITEREEYSLKFQQFTGLKDKNGKEIYEGDVVRFTSGREQIDEKLAVEWDERRIGFVFKGAKYTFGNEDNYYGSFEVVGNIFENQELL